MTRNRPPSTHPAYWTAGEWFAAFTLGGTILFYLVRMTLDVNHALAVQGTRLEALEQRLTRLETQPSR